MSNLAKDVVRWHLFQTKATEAPASRTRFAMCCLVGLPWNVNVSVQWWSQRAQHVQWHVRYIRYMFFVKPNSTTRQSLAAILLFASCKPPPCTALLDQLFSFSFQLYIYIQDLWNLIDFPTSSSKNPENVTLIAGVVIESCIMLIPSCKTGKYHATKCNLIAPDAEQNNRPHV